MNDKVCIKALADMVQINSCKSKIECKGKIILQLSTILIFAHQAYPAFFKDD